MGVDMEETLLSLDPKFGTMLALGLLHRNNRLSNETLILAF